MGLSFEPYAYAQATRSKSPAKHALFVDVLRQIDEALSPEANAAAFAPQVSEQDNR